MRITNDWNEALRQEFEAPYFMQLEAFLKEEYDSHVIYPSYENLYQALDATPLSKVKVVILGQDPYHEPNQAHGLAFSVLPQQKKLPPSLRNIYKELADDIGCSVPEHGYLKNWADQGVLLLNTVLSVREHEANSHQNRGWETFTDAILRLVNAKKEPVVYLLWGGSAQKKESMLTNPNHLIIKSPHPSPLSAYRGFFGSKPFSKANAYLTEHGLAPIDWEIKE